jgi:hypothetical protein
MERAVIAAGPYLVAGLGLSLPLLLVPPGSTTTTLVSVHLAALVILGIALADRLAPLADSGWFAAQGWGAFWRLLASGVGVVIIVTGVVALVTLASSAALRYPPSLQFLQLLSALDIAWAAAAIMVGALRLWGRGVALVAGVLLGVLCVWAIWNYLTVVGLGPDGQWIVDGGRLMTLVIPFDMLAAFVAVVLFVAGTRRSAQAIEQSSPQS